MSRHALRVNWNTVLFATMPFFAIASGVFGGWLTFSVNIAPRLERLEATSHGSVPPPAPTSTRPAVEIVSVETRPSTPAYPSAFVTRRQSPVLTLIKKTAIGKTMDDQLVGSERAIGSAVALTSDGWLATTFTALNGLHLAELSVLWNGRVYSFVKGVRDQATDAVYLKIDTTDLPVTALVRAGDVVAGSAVWIEPRARSLFPETVSDVRLMVSAEPLSSERASRRFSVTGAVEPSWNGSAVWDSAGQLVGLLEAKQAGGWRVLPAGDLASALSGLLSGNDIRHASLGIRTTDLAGASFENGRGTLPMQGAWLHPDHHLNLPAVVPQGPAVSTLHDGDVIQRLERDILDGSADLGERLLDYRPETEVAISLLRQGSPIEVKVKLGSQVTSELLK